MYAMYVRYVRVPYIRYTMCCVYLSIYFYICPFVIFTYVRRRNPERLQIQHSEDDILIGISLSSNSIGNYSGTDGLFERIRQKSMSRVQNYNIGAVILGKRLIRGPI